MPGTITKSIRLDENIFNKIEEKRADYGLSFNDFVIYSINVQLGRENDKSIELLKLLIQWIRSNYNEEDFPDDITLRVFHHIRDDKKINRLYNEIIADDEDNSIKVSLHRRIGLMVKMVLNAKVKARSLPLDPKENLIRTFSFLEPSEK